METVRATIEWTPEIDRFVLWNDDLAGRAFVPEPFGDVTDNLLLEVDEHDEETGRIVGVELAILDSTAGMHFPSSTSCGSFPARSPYRSTSC